METKTRAFIESETFFYWIRENQDSIVGELGPEFTVEVLNQLVKLMKFLFDEHQKWLFNLISESGLTDQVTDVIEFPTKKLNPFKLVVDNTNFKKEE